MLDGRPFLGKRVWFWHESWYEKGAFKHIFPTVALSPKIKGLSLCFGQGVSILFLRQVVRDVEISKNLSDLEVEEFGRFLYHLLKCNVSSSYDDVPFQN